MSVIQNYVDVQITVEAARMATLGFNRVLFLFEDDALDRTKEVSVIDPVSADFGGTGSDLWKAFQTYASQPMFAGTAVVGAKRTAETWAEAMVAIREENDNWYGVVLVSKDEDDIKDVSAVIEAIKPGRILFAVTADSEVKDADSGNVAEVLSDLGRNRTALIYSTCTDGWANAGQAAYLSFEPGSFTFNYKELVGVKAEKLTATERQNLIDQNCQVQITVAGLKRLHDSGMVTSGEWIDIIHGVDWLTARISEDVYALLATKPKVPYTLSGAYLIDSLIRRNLIIASDAPHNLISDNFETIVPVPENQSLADRSNRKLMGFRFNATLQGAIHFVQIRGTLTV